MTIPIASKSPNSSPDKPAFALFNLGFRPFYLIAALWAAVSVPVWVAQYAGLLAPARVLPALAWHMHEMVFGFAVAVVTGFLFTAARAWTGLPTPTGGRLAAVVCLWLFGRLLMLTGPGPLAAMVDLAFLPTVAWLLWLPLRRARNRNVFFAGIVLALGVVNGLFHGSHLFDVAGSPLFYSRLGLAFIVMIVAIMGGRVTPAFTRNGLRSARIRTVRGLDAAALITLAATLMAWLADVPAWLVVPAAMAAAAANALRLWFWDPWSTRRDPILWILHLSYAWIPLGMLLLGLASAGIAGSTTLAMHALSVGAVGGMIIGMITRTARGHTGRPLAVSSAEVLVYALVHLAAFVRVILPLIAPSVYTASLVLSAVLWSVAFAIYVILYWPLLSRARADGKPG